MSRTIDVPINFNTWKNNQVCAMGIIFNSVTRFFNLPPQCISTSVLPSSAEGIALMRECQNICGDSMAKWLGGHTLCPSFLLRFSEFSIPKKGKGKVGHPTPRLGAAAPKNPADYVPLPTQC